jgi:lysyl endopeptidase
MSKPRRHLALVAALLAAFTCTPALAAEHATGEPSRSSAVAAPQWKLHRYPVARMNRVQYKEVAIKRLLEVQRKNATRGLIPTQIGIARRADLESTRMLPAKLSWVATTRGGAVARMEIRSPDALALRAGLQIDRLEDRVELRFAGSDNPARVVALLRGAEIKRLLDAKRTFWTPSTDGDTQIIEIYRPAGIPAASVRLGAPRLSHLLANSRNNFRIIEKIGESGSCNVDTACRVSELGQRFVNAKNAVAHMQFVLDGSTYICSGTLLNDTRTSTQVPYFYSANHCFSTSEGAPVPSQMQTVATTLNTFWNYEATACNSGVSAPTTQLSGGATYLYSNYDTDGMLLRLNNPAPAGAYFAGWNSAALPASSAVLAIHHPAGDAKKVSSGQHISSDSVQHEVGWLSGTTEGGSSGSALFTLGSNGYLLRGGLHGGNASCANTGSTSNPDNRDYYSRFDIVFPNVRAYLAPDPIPLNGSQPLIPPQTSPFTTRSTTRSGVTGAAAREPRATRTKSGMRRQLARQLYRER